MTRKTSVAAGEAEEDVGDGCRRCLATGKVLPRDRLIRFVVGPEGQVVPDLAEKLPGRGLWVEAVRESLDLAARRNLFAKAARAKVAVDPDLLTQVEGVLKRRCHDLLGLARGAGAVVTGQPQVEEGLTGFAYILIADDAGKDCRRKLGRAEMVPAGLSKLELGAALGRDYVAAVGVKPHKLATKLRRELARWQGVRGDACDGGEMQADEIE